MVLAERCAGVCGRGQGESTVERSGDNRCPHLGVILVGAALAAPLNKEVGMHIGRATVVATTALALIGSSAVLAPAASAEDEAPVIVSVDARPEVVGLYKASRTQVTVDVRVTDDVAVTTVQVSLLAKPGIGDDDVPPDSADASATLVSGTAQDGTWRATFFMDKRARTGLWSTEITVRDSTENGAFAGHVYDEGYSVQPVDDVSIKRNTDIRGFNVAEPVTRGATIRMSGRLLRLDPVAGYVGYSGKTVRVLFRPAGTSTWVSRGTVTTSSQGYFTNSRTFRAWRDGAWKVQFDGTANYLPETSHADYVDTR